jgi:TolB-like protein
MLGGEIMNYHQNEQMNGAIAPQAVLAQLGRILASDAFVRARRIQRFLQYIVEETLAGRSDQLGEYAIGTAVFDRGADFEPAVDPIVRIDARRLRYKLLEYYRELRSPSADTVLIDIPKGAYVPVFLPFSGRDEVQPAASDGPRRVAVLPFDVLSVAPESAMYGRALCMSLTANLTNLDGLEAVAHGYLRELPIREAASELRLSHLIHGSVLESSDRCRVIVNLIHMADGTQLWAREYDFESGQQLTFQSEITGSVLREVTACLGLKRPQPRQLAMVA